MRLMESLSLTRRVCAHPHQHVNDSTAESPRARLVKGQLVTVQIQDLIQHVQDLLLAQALPHGQTLHGQILLGVMDWDDLSSETDFHKVDHSHLESTFLKRR